MIGAPSISGDEARQLIDDLPTLAPEAQAVAREQLTAYRDQLVLTERKQADDRFEKIYTDDKEFAKIAQSDTFQTAAEVSPFPGAVAKRTANIAWFAHRLEQPIDDVIPTYEMLRDGLAKSQGYQGVVTDDAVFGIIQSGYQDKRTRTEALTQLQMQSVAKALEDANAGEPQSISEGFTTWLKAHPDLVDEENEAGFYAQARDIYYETLAESERLAGPAGKIWQKLSAYAAGDASSEDVMELAKSLSAMPIEDRQAIYQMAGTAAMARGVDKEALAQLQENFGKAFARGFDFAGKAGLAAAEDAVRESLAVLATGDVWLRGDEATLRNIQRPSQMGPVMNVNLTGRRATPDEVAKLEADLTELLPTFQIAREMKALARDQIDPIKPIIDKSEQWLLGSMERGAYGLAGSMGILGVYAISPAFGTAAIYAEELDSIRVANPEMDPDAARGIAMFSAGIQSWIERFQLQSIAGRLPIFGEWVKDMKKGWTRAAVTAGLSIVEQNIQEGAQDAISMFVPALAAAVREDMPDVDLGVTLGDYLDARSDVFFAVLPLGMIAGGAAKLQDFKGQARAAIDPQILEFAGFSREQMERIAAAQSKTAMEEVIQAEWAARTPENIAAGKEKAQKFFDAAKSVLNADDAPTVESRTMPDGSREYVVTAADGKVLATTKSEDAALEVVRDAALSKQEANRVAMRDMIKFFQDVNTKAGRTGEQTFEMSDAPKTFQQVLESGEVSIEQLHERMRIAGIDPETTSLGDVFVFGENVAEVRDGVFTDTIKLYRGADPMIVVEERVEGETKRAIATGSVTVDWLRAQVQSYEAATGEQLIADGATTEQSVIEAVSTLGKAYIAGRIRDPQLPTGLRAFFRQTMDFFKDVFARAGRLRNAIATGKVSKDFEMFLAQSVGLDTEQQISMARDAALETTFAIGVTVAPVRVDALSELSKDEVNKRAGSAKFIHLQQIADDIAQAYGVTIAGRQPIIGGWTEDGKTSLEVPEVITFDTNDLNVAEEMAALIAASAPELQNGAMVWKDDVFPLQKHEVIGEDTVLYFSAKDAKSALAIAKDLNAAGVKGFSYDVKTKEFSLVLAGLRDEDVSKVHEYVKYQTEQGSVSARRRIATGTGSAKSPTEGDYRKYIENARRRAADIGGERGAAISEVVSRAERRVDRYEAALKISKKAKRIIKNLPLPTTSAKAIIQELNGLKFENIRALGLYLDDRFQRINGFAAFPIGSLEGITYAAEAFTYDILDGLSRDGSGMGWYDERVSETIREVTKLHPEFAQDPLSLAVYIGILSTTSQGYTVVTNFAQTERVWEIYTQTGRIPTDLDFAKSTDPINKNLADIQSLIDQYGLQGYADFMDAIVTGRTLRDQYGMQPTGVTLTDEVRGNRFLGPKIGSFFNNLRGRFDTITMDLWYTRTMHRYLGETVVPLSDPRVQKAIKSFRDEIQKPGARTYNVDIATALQSDEATIRAALTVFGRWGAGKNDYAEKGYTKFKDGYKIEKAARTIHAEGTMKGAPKNKSYRTYFTSVVAETQKNLAALGIKLTEADIQAIIWYREKNLFAETGVANNAAKPADYLDAVMVARRKASGADITFAIGRREYADRLNAALASLDSDPDLRRNRVAAGKKRLAEIQSRIKDGTPLTGKARQQAMEEAKAAHSNAVTALEAEEAAALDGVTDAKERNQVKFSYLAKRRSIDSKLEADVADASGATLGRDDMIRAMGELEALIAVLPVDARGRIGGYKKLAEYKTSTGRINFLENRIAKIGKAFESWLQNYYDNKMQALLKRAVPAKDEAGKRKVGKAGAEIHALFDSVRRFIDATMDEANAHAAALEAAVMAGELSPETEARYIQEAALVPMVADWKTADAARREAAFANADRLWNFAFSQFKIQKLTERMAREDARKRMVASTGKVGTAAERDAKAIADAGLKAGWKDNLLGLLNFEQAMQWVFGERNADVDAIIESERKASNTKTDAIFSKLVEIDDIFSTLAGGKLAGEKLWYRMTQKTISVVTPAGRGGGSGKGSRRDGNTRQLSEMEAITAMLMWRQEDGQRHMMGVQDEQGNTLTSWSYDQEFMNDLEAALSPAGRKVRDFLIEKYAAEWETLNPIYRELNGIDLPRNENYAPLTVMPVQASGNQTVDPVTGNTFSGASTTPGSLRSRGTSTAEPDFRDAVATYIAHTKQMEHWKAYAKFTNDARALLNNRDVGNAVTAAAGEVGMRTLRNWVDIFTNGGTRDAAAHLAMTQMITRILSRATSIALVGRIGTLAVQATQIGAALAEMPMRAYVSRMARLLSGQLSWKAAMDSPYIQRRIAQMPPAVQIAMDGLRAENPNALRFAVRKLGELISGVDGFFTAGTFAMVYDYQIEQLMQDGATRADAERIALQQAERITDRIAQPTRPGARSLFENSMTNPLARVAWAFASEARKNLGLAAYAMAKRPPLQVARVLTYVVLINGLGATLIRNAWRDARDDDDDEIFDEKNWNFKRMMVTAATDPFYGIPVVGDMIQSSAFRAMGVYQPDSNLLQGTSGAIPAMMRMPEMLSGDMEAEEVLRDVDMMLSGFGLLNSNIAAAASLSHLARDLFGVSKNFTNPDE